MATHLYVRSDPSDATHFNELAATCDHHKMGDGKEGRRDWGWTELAMIPELSQCAIRTTTAIS